MGPLDLVNLTPLMQRTKGRPEVVIGLIDGPVAVDHPDLINSRIQAVSVQISGACTIANSMACAHGTFVAGILCAKSESGAPAICPHCTLLVRPIFTETDPANRQMPTASPEELAAAIIDAINAGARVINLSAALMQPSAQGERELQEALDYAAARDVIVAAAAGNQGNVGSTLITRHPWVIPVTACNLQGQPLGYSNMGRSIGNRGWRAPGENIASLGANGRPLTISGTSAATPFVTGTLALLLSEFPKATATQLKYALTQTSAPRHTPVPPLLNAWAGYQIMAANHGRQ